MVINTRVGYEMDSGVECSFVPGGSGGSFDSNSFCNSCKIPASSIGFNLRVEQKG